MAQQIQVQYFAMLRERRGLSVETIATEVGTAAELFAELDRQHALGLPRERLRVAVNDEFANWSVKLKAGDRVAFIPPVAGG